MTTWQDASSIKNANMARCQVGKRTWQNEQAVNNVVTFVIKAIQTSSVRSYESRKRTKRNDQEAHLG